MSAKTRVVAVLVATLTGLTGCDVSEPRWGLQESDVGFAIEVVDDDYYRPESFEERGGCNFKEWSDATTFALRSEESMTVEYLGDEHRIQVQVSPYNAEYRVEFPSQSAPGAAMSNVREELGDCELNLSLPESERFYTLEFTEFELEGDSSDAAHANDKDPSTPSEPVGWFQYHESYDEYLAGYAMDDPELFAIDGMKDRYAQGYYAIVEDAFVAVHVVSSVEPEISAEQVMDVMREKLAADSPEARFEGAG